MAFPPHESNVLTASQWRQLCGIFFAAIEKEPESRHHFVVDSCPDPNLQYLAFSLLEAHAKSGGILDDAPPINFSAEPQPILLPGQVLSGRFEIVRLVGTGGMGEVYEARDLRKSKTRVAVKVLHDLGPDDFRTAARFKRETRLARTISHPNVCRVFGLFNEWNDGAPYLYLTMEYLEGITLAQKLAQVRKETIWKACQIGRQLAEGLAAAHTAGVVHRDFKPSNVILSRSAGEPERAVITDFGLARRAGREKSSPVRTTQPLGTMHYMSPEQAEGDNPDARSDVYALGIVLWETFTSKRPLPGEASPRIYAPRIPKIWEQIILRCVERHPLNRFANAGEVRQAMADEDQRS